MENRKETMTERRRRKVVSRPVLVRSEKAGQVMSASFDSRRNTYSIWKGA